MYTYLNKLVSRHQTLSDCAPQIEKAISLIIDCYRQGGKVMTCGNGGSASDSAHIVGELMKGFLSLRPLSAEWREKLECLEGESLAAKLQSGLPAVDLTAMSALFTAVANDMGAEYGYAQQAFTLANEGDIVIGISTSGNAQNVHNAAIAAKAKSAKLIGLTGKGGGRMVQSGIYDVIISVPERETYLIQEDHLAIYHAICADVEEVFFGPTA